MRAFVGVFLPEKIREYVAGLQSELEKLPMNCKMVEAENMHICLSFLGEVEEPRMDDIKKALSELFKSKSPFEVSIGGIKTIPSQNYIRVVVLEVVDSAGMLNSMSSMIKESIGGDTKPPHITLCRVRHISNKEKVLDGLRKIQLGKMGEKMNFTIDSVDLVTSALTQDGPVYSVAHKTGLTGSATGRQ